MYRTILSYNYKWDSVKELIYCLGRIDVLNMVQMRTIVLLKDCLSYFHKNYGVYNIMLHFSY